MPPSPSDRSHRGSTLIELLVVIAIIAVLIAFAAMASVTTALFSLLIVLAVKLRQREFQTMFRLGSSRFLIAKLVVAELCILLSLSGLFTLAAMVCLAGTLSRITFAG